MTKTGMAAVCAAAALTLTMGTVLAQQPPFKRTVLQQVGISVPGREVVTARVDIPKGVSVGRHTHFGEEVGYVQEGTLLLEIEGQAPRTVKAGEAFLVPTGAIHNATANSAGDTVVVASYVVEKGKPLATPAK